VAQLADVWWGLLKNCPQDGALLPGIEPAAAKHFEENHAEREEIGAPVEGFQSDLLWGRVAFLAFEDSCARLRRGSPDLGDAEVRESAGAVVSNKDVVRGDVAMYEVQGASIRVAQFVRGVQTVGDLCCNAHTDLYRYRPLGTDGRLQNVVQRASLDVLHDEIGALRVAADIKHADDVGVPDQATEAGLAEKHFHQLAVLAEVRMQPFHGIQTLEAV